MTLIICTYPPIIFENWRKVSYAFYKSITRNYSYLPHVFHIPLHNTSNTQLMVLGLLSNLNNIKYNYND